MKLYKYTSLEFIPSCVENGVYASNLGNINDPYEGKGISYPSQYRVVCMTNSPFQMLMWVMGSLKNIGDNNKNHW